MVGSKFKLPRPLLLVVALVLDCSQIWTQYISIRGMQSYLHGLGRNFSHQASIVSLCLRTHKSFALIWPLSSRADSTTGTITFSNLVWRPGGPRLLLNVRNLAVNSL
jgi:hypothetical protein